MAEQTPLPDPRAERPTLPGALPSLVFGILSLTCLGPLGSIPAVIFGHIALATFRRNPGTYDGRGMAVAGMVVGYAQLALFAVAILAILLGMLVGWAESS